MYLLKFYGFKFKQLGTDQRLKRFFSNIWVRNLSNKSIYSNLPIL